MVKEIKISDYDYPLPEEKIALHPCTPRDACKLLVRNSNGSIAHDSFTSLPALLPANALMVCNNTRVINARVKMRKATGAEIEIFCLDPVAPRDYALMFQSQGSCSWDALIGNLKRWKEGPLTKELTLADGTTATLTARRGEAKPGNAWCVEFSWTPAHLTFASIIDAAGYIPIPPYLNRASEEVDSVDYQTVYSKIKGSVAAPTAGLHFTPAILNEIKSRGIDIEELTLHVGAGTFQPVKCLEIGSHPMHTETFCVTAALIEKLIAALESGSPIVAVGTTSVRTLESLPYIGRHIAIGSENPLHVSQWEAYQEGASFSTIESLQALLRYINEQGESLNASTAIMIAPGFSWRLVSTIVTNFHQPQSTLLLLVASFLSRNGRAEEWKEIYREALERDYRFLSYGDSCLLF